MLKSIVSALSQRLPVKQITGNPTLHCTQNLYKHSAVNESKSSCNFSHASVANTAADTTKQEQNNSNCAAVRANTSSKAFRNTAKRANKSSSKTANRASKSSSNSRKHSNKHYKASKSYKQSHVVVRNGKDEVCSSLAAVSLASSAQENSSLASSAANQALESKLKPSCVAQCVRQEINKTAKTVAMNFGSEKDFASSVAAGVPSILDSGKADALASSVEDHEAPVTSPLASFMAVGGKYLRLSVWAAMLGCASVALSSCSTNDDLPEREVLVEDPVSFSVATGMPSILDGGKADALASSVASHAAPVTSPLASFMAVGGKYLRLSVWAAMLGCASVALSSCSTNDDLPEREVLVEDPVSFSVSGVSGELLTNVEAHLGSLAVIPKKRAFFYIREIKEVTTKALRAYGYYHPKIKVTLPEKDKKEDTVVKVEVEQGKPLYIRQSRIEVLGEGVKYKVFEDLLKNTELGSYKILNHGVYEELKNAIHNTALSMGFFDGKFTSKRIMVYQNQNFADIELVYDSGKRYDFGELIMNDETAELYKPSHPLQNFKTGDKFATKKINNFVSSLNQTGYYNSVDVRPVLDKAENFQVPVEMHLERRANNNMRIGLGYSTDEGPRVLLEWNKPLLNSRGDSLSTLMTLTKITQDAQLVYKIPGENPNLDYYTINAAQTHTDFNDTLSDRTQLAVHYIANQTGRWRRDYALRLEYEDFDQAKEEGRTLNLMPAVSFTRRESSGGYDPTRGYSITLEALGAAGAISDNSFVQVKGTYKGVIAPSENTRFLFRLEQGANFGPDAGEVPPSLRFFAGGDNSIRGFGYRDRSAKQPWGGLKGAKYLTVGSAEFQFPMGISNSRLALFCDVGTATDDYKDELMYGPGLGYRFLSSYGIVRVDVAVGLQKNEEQVYQLHFAFGPEF